MSLAKNFYNRDVPTKNLITTITGIVTAVMSILVFLNVINIDQSTALQGHILTISEAVTAIYGSVVAIIAMFKATDG